MDSPADLGWRGTWLEGESFSGVRFTREIRNIRTYTGGVYTFCSSRLIRPSPRPFRPPISFLLFLAGGGTKSGRGRRHKSLNPSPKGSGPLSLSLFSTGFSSVFPFFDRGGKGEEEGSKSPSSFPPSSSSILEEECRCSRRNFRGTDSDRVGMRRSSCSIVRQGISLAVYRFSFRRRDVSIPFQRRFRPQFFQLCKRESLLLTSVFPVSTVGIRCFREICGLTGKNRINLFRCKTRVE